MGLLYTDGNINKEKNKITLSLADKDVIEKLYPLFSDIEKRKIYIFNDKNENHSQMYTIINTNKDAINELLNLGITEHKSLTIEFPNIIQQDNLLSFIRGVFDGDGSVYTQITRQNGKEYKYINISFTTGYIKFAKGLIENLKDLNIHSTLFADKRSCKKNTTYYVYIRKKDSVKKFVNLIYAHDNICINRKKLKCLKI